MRAEATAPARSAPQAPDAAAATRLAQGTAAEGAPCEVVPSDPFLPDAPPDAPAEAAEQDAISAFFASIFGLDADQPGRADFAPRPADPERLRTAREGVARAEALRTAVAGSETAPAQPAALARASGGASGGAPGDRAPGHLALGCGLLAFGQAEAAARVFVVSILREGPSSQALVGLGAAYLALGWRGAAAQVLARAAAVWPADPAARNAYGAALHDQRRIVAARAEPAVAAAPGREALGAMGLRVFSRMDAPDLPAPDVDGDVERAEARNPLGRRNLNAIMLSVAGPEEAFVHIREALNAESDNPARMRGLARSLARNGQTAEAQVVFRDLLGSGAGRPEDRVDYALVLTRMAMWPEAQARVRRLPPGCRSSPLTMRRAALADRRPDWAAADAAHEPARATSPQPAQAPNNRGVSRLSRGRFDLAEGLSEQALIHDPELFAARNNLAIASALQGDCRLPPTPLRKQAIVALRQGKCRQGERSQAISLRERALSGHPAHCAPAADKLVTPRGAG